MKTINLKSILQGAVLIIVLTSSVFATRNLYRELKQVYNSRPVDAGISCLYQLFD